MVGEGRNKRPLDQERTDQMIKLLIKAQDGTIVYFNVKTNKPMKEVFLGYCKHKKMEYREFEFLYDGKRLSDRKTVEQLGLEDGVEIDAMLHQGGGGMKN